MTLLLDGQGCEAFNSLPAQTKSCFTRTFNQMQQTSIKRVKQGKQAQKEKKDDYHYGFDPERQDRLSSSGSESSETEEFTAVGKTKSVSNVTKSKPKKEGKATKEMMARGRGKKK